MARVLIADDHAVIRTRLRQIIEGRMGLEICAEADNGPRALELGVLEKPDIAVLDVGLPLMNGIILTERLAEACPQTSVMMFTMHDDDETVTRAVHAGAKGYVLKSDGESELEAAITALSAHRTYFSAPYAELFQDITLRRSGRRSVQDFTARERQVAQLIVEGNNNKQIAHLLGISVKTVESHRAASMRKAGTRTAATFVRFVIKHRLVDA